MSNLEELRGLAGQFDRERRVRTREASVLDELLAQTPRGALDELDPYAQRPPRVSSQADLRAGRIQERRALQEQEAPPKGQPPALTEVLQALLASSQEANRLLRQQQEVLVRLLGAAPLPERGGVLGEFRNRTGDFSESTLAELVGGAEPLNEEADDAVPTQG